MTEPRGSQVPGAQSQPGQSAADPSMEDILASIRRILSEDEAPPPAEPAPAAALASGGPDDDDVLVLDASMMAADDKPSPAALVPQEPMPLSAAERPIPSAADQPPIRPAADQPPMRPAADQPPALLAPEAADAATLAMETLVRTLGDRPNGDPQTPMLIRAGGPTIEDIVREEIRPLLKAWLDVNLPPLTERLVREEIQRLSGRVAH